MVHKFILFFCLLALACTPAPTVTIRPTIEGTDAKIDAAIQQARDTLDTFVQTIATPHADRAFVAVKVRFTLPDESTQDIWVDDVIYTDGVFRGNMGDDIPELKLEMGKKITIDEKDIIDWMIVQDGKLIGGYTIRLAVERMSPEERERFLKTLDYSIDD